MKNIRSSFTLSNGAPWIEERQIYEKTMASLHDPLQTKQWFLVIARELEFVQKFEESELIFMVRAVGLRRKEEGIRDYMFSVAVEATLSMIHTLRRNLQTVSHQERFLSSTVVEESENISTKMELYS